MFFGTHLLLYSRDPEADRAFLRDVLEIPAVDAGEGWLIFAMPPAEMGIHPGEMQIEHAGANLAGGTVYLMCRDLPTTMKSLEAKGVVCAPVQEADWGVITSIPLPGGSSLGVYEPRHPLAIEVNK
jgi:hypothetical protein